MSEYLYSAFGMDIKSTLAIPLPYSTSTKPAETSIEIVEGEISDNPDLPYAIGRIRYGRIGGAIQAVLERCPIVLAGTSDSNIPAEMRTVNEHHRGFHAS